jgi:hypothetical protein
MLERDKLQGYTGLHAFHKYWGKKPAELYRSLITDFSEFGDTVLDPFVGSGVISLESAILGRNFTGIDINPVAVNIAKLMARPPKSEDVAAALKKIEAFAKKEIEATYLVPDGALATHYLWEKTELNSIWLSGPARRRIEVPPSKADFDLFQKYSGYPRDWPSEEN